MSLTTKVDSWDDKIYVAKDRFVSDLSTMRVTGVRVDPAFFDEVETTNSRFETESMRVSDLFYAEEYVDALDLHVQVEHETSHELEDQLNGFIAESDRLAMVEQVDFEADRRFFDHGRGCIFGGEPRRSASTRSGVVVVVDPSGANGR